MGVFRIPIWAALLISCMIPAKYADSSAESVDDGIPQCEKEGDTLDLRPEFTPAPGDGIEIRAPAVEIEPYSQGFWCYWGTYTGPTTGVTHFEPFQSDGYDHHNLLRAVTGIREDDGVMDVCPPAGEIGHYGPMYWPTGVEPGPETRNWLDLPEGVAMQLRQNQKWVLDMHYINPTGCTLLVQNGVNLGTIPADDVDAWAAPLRLDAGETVTLPANQEAALEFECEWPWDVNILSIGSHMHEYGKRFRVDHLQSDGNIDTVYQIDPWDPEYRNFPVMLNYEDGGISVKAGESFKTSCAWSNPTDTDIGFPNEMCASFVSAYPLETPMTCSLGEWLQLQ